MAFISGALRVCTRLWEHIHTHMHVYTHTQQPAHIPTSSFCMNLILLSSYKCVCYEPWNSWTSFPEPGSYVEGILWMGDRTRMWLNVLLLRKLKQQPGLLINQLLNPLGMHCVLWGRCTEAACFAVLASRWPFHRTMKETGGKKRHGNRKILVPTCNIFPSKKKKKSVF